MKNFFGIRLLDILIAICFIVVCIIGFLPKKGTENTASIYFHGELIYSVSLSQANGEIQNIGGCEIQISQEGVKFISSNCPNQLCVKSNIIQSSGEVCACVPNGVVACIESEKIISDIVTY